MGYEGVRDKGVSAPCRWLSRGSFSISQWGTSWVDAGDSVPGPDGEPAWHGVFPGLCECWNVSRRSCGSRL